MPSTPYLPLTRVIAVGAGNALEFYDFLTFSFFAIQIGHSFFPGGAAGHGLLYSLATFGVGFATRPLGAFILGGFGDRHGRTPAMLLSFGLMGASIVAMSLTPSYARIGPAAPILLVFWRLVQGFALGGEVGPSTAYLIESAPPHRRGLYVSLQYMTQDMAVLAAGVVGFTLANVLTADQLEDWGWRLAFLLGAALVPLGLRLRTRLPETLHAADPTDAHAVPGRLPVRLVIAGLMIIAGTTTYLYGVDYITTFAQDSLHLSASRAFLATIVLGLAAVVCDPLGGLLSDRVGRKKVMLGASLIGVVIALPGYAAMVYWHSPAVVYGVIMLLSMLQGFLAPPGLIALTEAMPKSLRSGAVATIYAVSTSCFGGTTQFTVKYLAGVLGTKLAPGIYMTVFLIVGMIGISLIRETAPLRSKIERSAG